MTTTRSEVGALPAHSAVETREYEIARRNALLYAACSAFGAAASPISIALGGLAGSYLLGADKSLATAPITGFNIGVALAALPAAMLMHRVGRRKGFISGAMVGICGMMLASWALVIHSFLLFCLALMLNGMAAGFSQQYRFAAADGGPAQFRARAISWVLTGGVAAAIIGPQLAIWTTDALAPVPFAGAYLAASGLFLISIGILTMLRPSAVEKPAAGVLSEPARPLGEIVRQPRFVTAVLVAASTYGLMAFVMTAAPLAMIGCGFSQTEATLGIQWHVLAMFAPSYFTGRLIVRYGKEKIIAAGLALLSCSALVGLMGIELANFWLALILLGVGWNLGFIGATAMLTDTYRPAERNKAQGVNDLLLFGSVAFSSLLSGQTLNAFGWSAVNLAAFPAIVISILALLWLAIGKPEGSSPPISDRA